MSNLNQRNNYLLLMHYPSVESRRQAFKSARELNITVTMQHGIYAVEVLATTEEAERLYKFGLFKLITKSSVNSEHLEKLTGEENRIAKQWNTRFSEEFRKTKKDKKHSGKSWGDKELQEPAPFSKYGVDELQTLIEKHVDPGFIKKIDLKKTADPAEDNRAIEKRFQEFSKDPTELMHLRNLWYRLDMKTKRVLVDYDFKVILEILRLLLLEAVCWKMNGEIAVGIVFIESSLDNGPKFGNTERSQILQEIMDGLKWLAGQHPAGNLSWVTDTQFTQISIPNTPDANDLGNAESIEALWRNAAMQKVNYFGNTYSGDWAGLVKYREDMRVRNFSAHSIAILVTPYGSGWHAYAGGSRLVLAKHQNWGGWGQGTLDIITSHEISHLFGAADEYTGSGSPCGSCDGQIGCDKIPNGNCGSCAKPKQDCIMAENQHRMCDYTQAQIGWSDLFLELWTADDLWAGTDDDIWLDIGDKTYYIDTNGVDDFERGSRIGYAIWDKSISKSDIKRIMIRKSGDGFSGGWKLKRARVFFRGEVICDQTPNIWLEDDRLAWTGCIFDREIVSTLTVKIATADVTWAGTDDDVTITLAGRTWNLDTSGNDFERGDTNTFVLDPGTSLYTSGIRSVRIHKSPDGFSGGWKLKGVQIIVNGMSIYNNQAINKWLEDTDRNWTASW